MSARTRSGFLSMALVISAAPAGSAAPPSAGEQAERAYRAGKAATSKSDQRRLYAEGVAVAKAALAKDPNDPGALLWYTANLAAEALTHGKLYTLRVIPELERTLLHLESVDAAFDHAAAARVLGRLYHKAPAVISIGSDRKAADFLERALARAPDFPGNQAFAAELYADRRDCARAKPLAEKIMARSDLDRFGSDAEEWRAIARTVLRDCR
jgi:hypothetical protein